MAAMSESGHRGRYCWALAMPLVSKDRPDVTRSVIEKIKQSFEYHHGFEQNIGDKKEDKPIFAFTKLKDKWS